MARPEALIFDLDGTLVDSAPGICASARAAGRVLGYHDVADAAITPLIGLPLRQMFQTIAGPDADDVAAEAWIAQYRLAFDRIALPATAAFPGVRETLEYWRRNGRRLAVATSKRTDVAERVIDAAGLTHLFETVVGGDQVVRGKPNPDMALRVLDLLAVPADRAVIVGDTTHDLGMARAAGVAAYAVSYGAHDRALLQAAAPVAIVDRFDDLRPLLD